MRSLLRDGPHHGLAAAFVTALAAVAIGCTPPPPLPPPPALLADPPSTPEGTISGHGVTELDRGLALIQNERFAEGIRLIEDAMNLGVVDAEATYHLAFAHEQLGHRREAESYYLKTLQLSPNHVNSRVNLAAIYLEEPLQPAKAINVLEPAVAADPKSTDIRLNLAYAYRLRKQLDKAAEQYRKALEIEDKVAVRQMLADALFDSGDKKDVVVEMRKLLGAFEKQPKALAAYGGRFAKVGAYADCVTAFGKAIEAEPANPSYYLNRGLCRHELHDSEEAAAQDFQKASELEPRNQAAHYYLGMSRLEEKRYELAAEALEKAFRLGPYTAIGKKAHERWLKMSQK